MKKTFVLLCALSLSGVAMAADKATYRKDLEETLKLEEQRIHDLQGSTPHDAALAKELLKLAEVKGDVAKQFAAKAKAFNDAAGLSTGAEKTELQDFAKDMQVYADHDRAFAEDRKKAAEILDRQAHEGEQAIKTHQATVEKIKAKLAALK